jgi:hypothetical protein
MCYSASTSLSLSLPPSHTACRPFNHLEWAKNAVSLSRWFQNQDGNILKAGRCLSASQWVLNQTKPETDEPDDPWFMTMALVHRQWGDLYNHVLYLGRKDNAEGRSQLQRCNSETIFTFKNGNGFCTFVAFVSHGCVLPIPCLFRCVIRQTALPCFELVSHDILFFVVEGGWLVGWLGGRERDRIGQCTIFLCSYLLPTTRLHCIYGRQCLREGRFAESAARAHSGPSEL